MDYNITIRYCKSFAFYIENFLKDKIEYTNKEAKDIIMNELENAKIIGKEVTAGTFIVHHKMKYNTFEKAIKELRKEGKVGVV